jgi:hypothetical protein
MPMIRRRRPVLRAAAIGGAAAYAGRRGAQAEPPQAPAQAAPQQPESAPPASTGTSEETIGRLRQLGELRGQGVLTHDEFEQQKQRLLAG